MTLPPSPTSVRIDPMSLNSNDNNSKKAASSSSQALENETTVADHYPVNLIRNDIFHLSVLVGKLSACFLEKVPMDSTNDIVSEETRRIISSCTELSTLTSQLLSGLETTASRLSLNLPTCIWKKMELNRKKYPVELCKGKAGK
jgi:hypothetical protein